MTYSNMVFDPVLVAFGNSEGTVENVFTMEIPDSGFGMYFVKFNDGSDDRVFLKYVVNQEIALKELDLGDYEENGGELVITDEEGLNYWIDVEALDEVLELEYGTDNGYLEITDGVLKPYYVVVSDAQYDSVVKDGGLTELLEKEDVPIEVPGKEPETTVVEVVEKETAPEETVAEVVEQEIPKETTVVPEETTAAETTGTVPEEKETTASTETTAVASGKIMTPEEQSKGPSGYYVTDELDRLGPGVCRTTNVVGMTGEAGLVITFTDPFGGTNTCVTSGEVVYYPKERAFYYVVTPLTSTTVSNEELLAYYDAGANYIIGGNTEHGFTYGDLRATDIRAFK